MPERMIENTTEPTRHPWPEDVEIQGGTRSVSLRGDRNPSWTLFVEAFWHNTFLRGEGDTVAGAETACWEKYQRLAACPAHPDHGPFEARQYTNGCGFCTLCGTWFASVLPTWEEATTDA
jgi:hypothetical protein